MSGFGWAGRTGEPTSLAGTAAWSTSLGETADTGRELPLQPRSWRVKWGDGDCTMENVLRLPRHLYDWLGYLRASLPHQQR